jgi:HPr kinase/phosphorylase
LELLSGVEGLSRVIRVSEVNRPGLSLSGYFEHFAAERIQIFGLGEYSYLKSLPIERQTEILERILSFPETPCCILARGLDR